MRQFHLLSPQVNKPRVKILLQQLGLDMDWVASILIIGKLLAKGANNVCNNLDVIIFYSRFFFLYVGLIQSALFLFIYHDIYKYIYYVLLLFLLWFLLCIMY